MAKATKVEFPQVKFVKLVLKAESFADLEKKAKAAQFATANGAVLRQLRNFRRGGLDLPVFADEPDEVLPQNPKLKMAKIAELAGVDWIESKYIPRTRTTKATTEATGA